MGRTDDFDEEDEDPGAAAAAAADADPGGWAPSILGSQSQEGLTVKFDRFP